MAAANEIGRVYGILNGTRNYILTTMAGEGTTCRRARRGAGAAMPRPTRASTSTASTLRTSCRSSPSVALRHARLDFGDGGDHRHSPGHRRRHRRGAPRFGYLRPAAPGEADERHEERPVPARPPLPGPARATRCPSSRRDHAVVAEGNFVGRLLFQGARRGRRPDRQRPWSPTSIDIARGEYGPAFAMPADALGDSRSPR